MSSGSPQHLLALGRGKPTPEVIGGEGDPKRAGGAEARHRTMFAQRRPATSGYAPGSISTTRCFGCERRRPWRGVAPPELRVLRSPVTRALGLRDGAGRGHGLLDRLWGRRRARCAPCRLGRRLGGRCGGGCRCRSRRRLGRGRRRRRRLGSGSGSGSGLRLRGRGRRAHRRGARRRGRERPGRRRSDDTDGLGDGAGSWRRRHCTWLRLRLRRRAMHRLTCGRSRNPNHRALLGRRQWVE